MKVLAPFFSVLSLIACTFAVVAPPPHHDGRTFDFIVVGAGAGGSPLASRLARAGFSVLLLDAGGDVSEHLTTQIPGMQGQASEDPAQRWEFYVDMYDDPKQQLKNVRMNWELPDGTIYTGLDPPSGARKLGILYPRASGLGGCTLHNSLVALYPFIRDWELLQELTGNTTWWAPEKMRQYFERVERAEYLPNSVAGHGFSGWLHISLTALDIVVEDLKLLGVVLGAIRAAGKSIPSFGLGGLVDSLLSLPQAALTLANLLLHDLNAPGRDRDSREGVWQIPISVDPSNSTRSSPYNLVRSTEQKYPLTVQLHTLVTKILFDRSGPRPRAIGVDYLEGESLYAADPRYHKSKKGKPGKAYAKYEVIVSTGAYNSPQLLKLSGVGPKEELARWKIPVVKDLPGVGENLQDRIEAVMVSESTTDFSIVSSCTFLKPVPESDPCYLTWKSGISPYLKGVYGSNGLALGITFRSSVAEGIEPDVFMSGVPIDFRGYEPSWATEGVQHTNHWTWYMLKAKNSNRAGSVTLKSTDPRDTPQISFRTLGKKTLALKSDQDDLQALYEAFLRLRKMRDDFVPLDGSHFTEVWPGADVQTQEDIKEYLMDQTWGHHVGGGNKIGADDDPLAVLDSDMRVRGIDGLRVVDASAWPRTPGYFPVIWIYCVSERTSDIIIAEYS